MSRVSSVGFKKVQTPFFQAVPFSLTQSSSLQSRTYETISLSCKSLAQTNAILIHILLIVDLKQKNYSFIILSRRLIFLFVLIFKSLRLQRLVRLASTPFERDDSLYTYREYFNSNPNNLKTQTSNPILMRIKI